MKRPVPILLLCWVIFTAGTTSPSYAQTTVPTFEAERITSWNQNQSGQPSARVSAPSHRALTRVLDAYDLYTLDAEAISRYVQGSSGPASFQLALGDEYTWNLTLEETNLLTPNYESFALTPQGTVATDPTPTVTFRGQLNTEGGGEVRLLLDGNQLKGFITYQGKKMYLENLSGLTPGVDDLQFVFYAEDEVQEDGSLMCLAKEGETYEQHIDDRINERAANGCQDQAQLEIATFALFERYRSAGSSQSAVNNEILGILNNVQANYAQFGITFKVVEQVVSTCASCNPWSTTRPSDILSEFTRWGPAGFKNQHDAGICFFDGNGSGTVGVAWLQAICTNNRYSVCDKLGTSESNRVLVAHEMGHNFGANHDNGGAPFIMAPSVNRATTWSSGSISSINNHISSRGCLACVSDGGDNPPPPPPENCGAPTNLRTSNVTTTTVRLVVNAASGANNYTYQFRVKGTSPWSSFDRTQASVDVQGLRAGTTYQWQVRTNCNNQRSAFVRGSEFKTRSSGDTPPPPEACTIPANPRVSNLRTTTANFNWQATSGASGYDFRIRTKGTSRWFAFSLGGTNINIRGMSPGTTYQWQVRTVCADGNSAYLRPRDFTTFKPRSGQVAAQATTKSPSGDVGLASLDGASEVGLIDLNEQPVALGANATGLIELTAYPNPFAGSFQLTLPPSDGEVRVNVFDIRGRLVQSLQRRLLGQTLALGQGLLPGAYTVQVMSPDFQGQAKMIKSE